MKGGKNKNKKQQKKKAHRILLVNVLNLTTQLLRALQTAHAKLIKMCEFSKVQFGSVGAQPNSCQWYELSKVIVVPEITVRVLYTELV